MSTEEKKLIMWDRGKEEVWVSAGGSTVTRELFLHQVYQVRNPLYWLLTWLVHVSRDSPGDLWCIRSQVFEKSLPYAWYIHRDRENLWWWRSGPAYIHTHTHTGFHGDVTAGSPMGHSVDTKGVYISLGVFVWVEIMFYM